MGMYTELHLNVELRRDTPAEVLDVLRYMLREIPVEERPETPDHPFFETGRWFVLFTMDSYYFKADTHSTLRWDETAEAHFLGVRCNLKNYDQEIQHFIDWITPYVEAEEGDFLGFYRYEETEIPTLIHYGKVPERLDAELDRRCREAYQEGYSEGESAAASNLTGGWA